MDSGCAACLNVCSGSAAQCGSRPPLDRGRNWLWNCSIYPRNGRGSVDVHDLEFSEPSVVDPRIRIVFFRRLMSLPRWNEVPSCIMRYMLRDTAWTDGLNPLFKQAIEVVVRYKRVGSSLF